MDYIFVYCDIKHMEISQLFLRSLWAVNSKCRVLYYGCNIDSKDIFKVWKGEIEFYKVNPKEFYWRIATHKIELLSRVPLKTNDRIIVFDPDILLQDDPFKMFDNNHDMYYTTRHYKCKYPVNGGVFGFKGTEEGRKIITFYNEQIHKKDWKPYKKFMKGYSDTDGVAHYDMTNWCIGQDWLCCVHIYGLPFDSSVKDVGPAWNYCPDYGSTQFTAKFNQVKQDLFDKIGDKRYKVLHFKGAMKNEMFLAAERMSACN